MPLFSCGDFQADFHFFFPHTAIFWRIGQTYLAPDSWVSLQVHFRLNCWRWVIFCFLFPGLGYFNTLLPDCLHLIWGGCLGYTCVILDVGPILVVLFPFFPYHLDSRTPPQSFEMTPVKSFLSGNSDRCSSFCTPFFLCNSVIHSPWDFFPRPSLFLSPTYQVSYQLIYSLCLNECRRKSSQ